MPGSGTASRALKVSARCSRDVPRSKVVPRAAQTPSATRRGSGPRRLAFCLVLLPGNCALTHPATRRRRDSVAVSHLLALTAMPCSGSRLNVVGLPLKSFDPAGACACSSFVCSRCSLPANSWQCSLNRSCSFASCSCVAAKRPCPMRTKRQHRTRISILAGSKRCAPCERWAHSRDSVPTTMERSSRYRGFFKNSHLSM
mmetsp:Transcript_98022/g.274416  ORF Transcript_98022/g.274416 Transcript_98022/m.274416 type:complete len:200 (+) Transcript_98022:45-644(+)